jgi:hypothetical protein
MLKYFFLLVSPLLLLSCKDDDLPNDECPLNLACTEELRSIVVRITLNGEPLILENPLTVQTASGEVFDFTSAGFFYPNGEYIVLTDGQFDSVEKDGSEFTFQASYTIDDETRSLEQSYIIGHDCCHIILLDGPETIEVN